VNERERKREFDTRYIIIIIVATAERENEI